MAGNTTAKVKFCVIGEISSETTFGIDLPVQIIQHTTVLKLAVWFDQGLQVVDMQTVTDTWELQKQTLLTIDLTSRQI